MISVKAARVAPGRPFILFVCNHYCCPVQPFGGGLEYLRVDRGRVVLGVVVVAAAACSSDVEDGISGFHEDHSVGAGTGHVVGFALEEKPVDVLVIGLLGVFGQVGEVVGVAGREHFAGSYLLEIDDGLYLFLGEERMRSIIGAACQAGFLTVEAEEYDCALGLDLTLCEGFGGSEQGCGRSVVVIGPGDVVGNHAEVVEVGGDDDVLVLEDRVAAFYDTYDVLTCRIGVVGGVHADMGLLAGVEGLGFLGLVDLLDSLGVGASGAAEDVVDYGVGHVSVDETFVIRSIGAGNPEVEEADGSVGYGVVELGLVEGVVVPHGEGVVVAAGVGSLALDQDDLAADIDAGIVVISEFGSRDAETCVDNVCRDVSVACHAAGEPAVSPGVGFGDPDGVLAFLAIYRKKYVDSTAGENFYAGMRKFLNIGAVVSGGLQAPFPIVVLYDGNGLGHAGRTGQAALQCGVGELLYIAEEFVGGDVAVHGIEIFLLIGHLHLTPLGEGWGEGCRGEEKGHG